MTWTKWLCGSAVLGVVAISVAVLPGGAPKAVAEPELPAPPANGEMGFVLTAFAPAIYQGKDDCPDGLAGTVRENYLATLPAVERTRLLQKENEVELTRRWQAFAIGPNNTNICSNPEAFDRPNIKTLKGKVAPGLNLDGDSTGKPSEGCAHENFTGVNGDAGVDNQAYRVMGCTRNWRGVDGMSGDTTRGYNGMLATGEHTVVLLLRGVDSLKDDPDVEVIFASTDDRPVLDTKRNFVPGASFTVSDNPQWRNVLKGRIHDGVLETVAKDIVITHRLGHGGVRGQRATWDLQEGRFRLKFKADGTLEGLFGAYQSPWNLQQTALLGGIGAATVAGIDCAAEYQTLMRFADGVKDPQTGKCTAVSIALDVAAVPAFINDRPQQGGKAQVLR